MKGGPVIFTCSSIRHADLQHTAQSPLPPQPSSWDPLQPSWFTSPYLLNKDKDREGRYCSDNDCREVVSSLHHEKRLVSAILYDR